jgi:hypothetical protein
MTKNRVHVCVATFLLTLHVFAQSPSLPASPASPKRPVTDEDY